jgi:hypothetical protein
MLRQQLHAGTSWAVVKNARIQHCHGDGLRQSAIATAVVTFLPPGDESPILSAELQEGAPKENGRIVA